MAAVTWVVCVAMEAKAREVRELIERTPGLDVDEAVRHVVYELTVEQLLELALADTNANADTNEGALFRTPDNGDLEDSPIASIERNVVERLEDVLMDRVES